ncbi:MAG TPA: hypothetical protein VK856_12910 [Anaerolineaceae bacterium]|jgi:hypothetical protein|nr:hypothetical protein [Anaerolineaceae bacterium]
MDNNRLKILQKVENGEISLEDASKLLGELDQGVVVADHNTFLKTPPIEPDPVIPSSGKKEKPSWSFVFWLLPLFFGVLLTIFSSNWLYQNYLSSGLGFKFWLSWIPFLIGVFMIYFAWLLQKARWIHINIKQPKGESPQRILIALPLPFQLLGFFLKIFKGKIPSKVSSFDIEEIIGTIDQQIKKDEPLYIDVNDEDGTKVEIYIG